MKNLFLTILIFYSIIANAQRGVPEPVLVQSDTSDINYKIATKRWVAAHPTGVTPISNIWYWSVNKYMPYPSRSAKGIFYRGSTPPNNSDSTLNYNGIFKANQFEIQGTSNAYYALSGGMDYSSHSYNSFYAIDANYSCQLQTALLSIGSFTRQGLFRVSGDSLNLSLNTVNTIAATKSIILVQNNGAITFRQFGNGNTFFLGQIQTPSNIISGTYIKVLSGGLGYVNLQPAKTSGDNFYFYTDHREYLPYPFFKVGEEFNKTWFSVTYGGWTYIGDQTATSNYTEFDSTGKFRSYGTGITWNDIIIPAQSVRPGSTAPSFAAYKAGLYLWQFAVNDEVHFSFEVPHDYQESSDMYFHVHWLYPGLESGTVSTKWELVSSHAGSGSTYSSAKTKSTEISSSTNYPDKSIISNIDTLSGTAVVIGETYVCRLRRITASGTAPTSGNPMLVSIGVHYKSNTNGSFNITTK